MKLFLTNKHGPKSLFFSLVRRFSQEEPLRGYARGPFYLRSMRSYLLIIRFFRSVSLLLASVTACTQSLFCLINGNERRGKANALHAANRRPTNNFSPGERSWEPGSFKLAKFPSFRKPLAPPDPSKLVLHKIGRRRVEGGVLQFNGGHESKFLTSFFINPSIIGVRKREECISFCTVLKLPLISSTRDFLLYLGGRGNNCYHLF